METVPLNSPQPKVVKALKVNDELEVEVEKGILLAKHKGSVAGSLTPDALADLLACIDKGKKYVAIVLKIAGGFCEVRIQPR